MISGYMRECNLLNYDLLAAARIAHGYSNACVVKALNCSYTIYMHYLHMQEEEFSLSLDLSGKLLYQGDKVFVIWKWSWMLNYSSSISLTTELPRNTSSMSEESDRSDIDIPSVMHWGNKRGRLPRYTDFGKEKNHCRTISSCTAEKGVKHPKGLMGHCL